MVHTVLGCRCGKQFKVNVIWIVQSKHDSLSFCSNIDSKSSNNTYLNFIEILFYYNFFSCINNIKCKIWCNIDLRKQDFLSAEEISLARFQHCQVDSLHKTYLVGICLRSHWQRTQSLQIKPSMNRIPPVAFYGKECCLLINSVCVIIQSLGYSVRSSCHLYILCKFLHYSSCIINL